MTGMRNDVTRIKEFNTEFVREALKARGTATKAQISADTGISVSTCGKILNEMFESGEVQVAEEIFGAYGRPAKSYRYNGSYILSACIGILVDGNRPTVHAQVIDLLGNTVEDHILDPDDVTVDYLCGLIGGFCRKYANLQVAAVGVPGYITHGVIGACSIERLRGIALHDELSAAFPDLKIVVENDMNASALGYYRTECTDHSTTLAVLYSPMVTRVERFENQEQVVSKAAEYGAGFVSDGRLLRGFSGFGGEIIYLPCLSWKCGMVPEMTVDIAIEIIGSIIPVLNPEIIVLTGSYFNPELRTEICRRCEGLFEKVHLPQIVFRRSLDREYLNGLWQLAMDEVSRKVILIESKA